jgi:hypothetical protein
VSLGLPDKVLLLLPLKPAGLACQARLATPGYAAASQLAGQRLRRFRADITRFFLQHTGKTQTTTTSTAMAVVTVTL